MGHDLASLNIQRGRDHGIPRYNSLRDSLGLEPAATFADITSDPEGQQALSDAYGGDIALVDAWVGGLAEAHVEGGVVGELFATIIADQFLRLMVGDPFFYLNDTDLQDRLQILRRHEGVNLDRVKLSNILAMNTDVAITRRDFAMTTAK